MSKNEITFLVYLGSGEQGRHRLEALRLEATRRGLCWNGKPSLGRLVKAITDDLLNDAARLRAGANMLGQEEAE